MPEVKNDVGWGGVVKTIKGVIDLYLDCGGHCKNLHTWKMTKNYTHTLCQ